jgi:hypothetical protein
MMMMTNQIPQTLLDRLWYEVFGSSMTPRFLEELKFINGNWESADAVKILFSEDEDEDKIKTKTITQMDLFWAWLQLVESGCYHCGSYSVGDLESLDSCSHIIIQQALWGEVKY